MARSSESLRSKTPRQGCKASGGLASGDTQYHAGLRVARTPQGHGCQEAGWGATWRLASNPE